MPRLRHYLQAGLIEAGCDEAGRGCLAGPVVAAAVILPTRVRLPGLDDSKRLTVTDRERLRPLIEAQSTAWCVASAEVEEIGRLNILHAAILAMHRAITGLKLLPQALLIDGDRFTPFPGIEHHCIIGGDGRYRSIAAASVLAKTHRDEFMARLHDDHPRYGWNANKGYPTLEHRAAIERHGPCAHHRPGFRLLRGAEPCDRTC